MEVNLPERIGGIFGNILMRGAFHYLTGSATRLMFAMVTKMFGIHGVYGDIKIHTRLKREQFETLKSHYSRSINTIKLNLK